RPVGSGNRGGASIGGPEPACVPAAAVVVRTGTRVRGVLGGTGAVARSPSLQQGEERRLRVRYRTLATASGGRRSNAGRLLHHGDVVHPVRHRNGLPLPVRRVGGRTGAVRTGGNRPVHRDRGLRLRLRLAARRAGLELSQWVSKRACPTGSCSPNWRGWSTGHGRTRCGLRRSGWHVVPSR